MTDIFDPVDPSSECISIDLSDQLLSSSKIAAYMYNQKFDNAEDKEKPFTPKAFPEKAIVIRIPACLPTSDIEIYLDTKDKVWDSKFFYNGKLGKLSADQMQQFFNSAFYSNMVASLSKRWPISDPEFNDLFAAVVRKQLRVGVIPEDEIQEANATEDVVTERDDAVNMPNKNVKLANKDITGDGLRDYTGSGRRIVHFGNSGVKNSSVQYICWPRFGKEFKWSTWKDWTKIKPFCKMKFKYNGRTYMIALTKLVDEEFDNRGFRGGDLDWSPPFGWLSQEEVREILNLSITQKFIHQCKKRVMHYISMKPSEVLEKIDQPDRVTLKEIEKTQRVIKHMVQQELSDPHEDNYKYGD